MKWKQKSEIRWLANRKIYGHFPETLISSFNFYYFINSFLYASTHNFFSLIYLFITYYETTVLTKSLEYKEKFCFIGKLCIVWCIICFCLYGSYFKTF